MNNLGGIEAIGVRNPYVLHDSFMDFTWGNSKMHALAP
jgi:hypothetical protein